MYLKMIVYGAFSYLGLVSLCIHQRTSQTAQPLAPMHLDCSYWTNASAKMRYPCLLKSQDRFEISAPNVVNSWVCNRQNFMRVNFWWFYTKLWDSKSRRVFVGKTIVLKQSCVSNQSCNGRDALNGLICSNGTCIYIAANTRTVSFSC